MSENKQVLLEDRIVSFLQAHKTNIMVLFFVTIVFSAVFYIFQYTEQQTQKTVFEEVYIVKKAYEDHMKTFSKKPLSNGEWLKESKKYISELERIFKAYPEKNATFQGVLYLASVLRERSQGKQALKLIDKYIDKVSEKSLFYSLFYFSKASLLEDKKNKQENQRALSQYEHILSKNELSFSHPEALLRKAFLEWKLGDKNKAETTLRKLLELAKTDKSYQPWASYAEAYLQMFLLKSKKTS